LDVLKFDIHVDATADGYRYLQRLTEIVPLPAQEFPQEYEAAAVKFFELQSNPRSFQTRDIIRYDVDTHTYYAAARFSDALLATMKSRLNAVQLAEFEAYLAKYFAGVSL
jgi:pilus assembly protein CpaF